MTSLKVRVEAFPTYLHAIGLGERTPNNVVKFFRQALAACKEGGFTALLFESRLTGRGINHPTLLFEAVSAAVPELRALRKLAYVPGPRQRLDYALFAETLARTRGINFRVFEDAAAAAEWLSS